MNLTSQEADLFFETYEGLLTFVHKTRKLEPKVRTRAEFSALDIPDQLPAREAFYAEPQLLDEYLAGPGKELPGEKRALLESWRRMVTGTFTIVNQLKTGAVFQGEGDRYYLVQGHRNPVAFAVGGRTPVLVEAALLPFQGRIVYDGILRSFPVLFGSGARRSTNSLYQQARRQGRILTTLEPETAPAPKPREIVPDRSGETAALLKAATALRGGNTPFEAPAYTLLRAAAGVAHLAATGDVDRLALDRELSKVRRALTRLQNVIYYGG